MKKIEKMFLWGSVLMVFFLLFVAITENELSWWLALYGWVFAAVTQLQLTTGTK